MWANGWMEGLTVAAIILGAVLGGLLIGDQVLAYASHWLGAMPFQSGLDSAPKFALAAILALYLIAAAFNLYVPNLPIDHRLPTRTLPYILRDFWSCFRQLWTDPLGQVSLAVTALFWGAGSTLRLIVLVWAAAALHLNLEQATQLTAVVAIGIGIGAALAGKAVPLDHSVRVLPVGIAMGLTVVAMVFVRDWRSAVPMLALIGIMAGYFVVPMNALLQHRGHLLMGAGHSIALQNFNENISILLMLGAYAVMIQAELPIQAIVVIFGLFVAASMALLARFHGHDQD